MAVLRVLPGCAEPAGGEPAGSIGTAISDGAPAPEVDGVVLVRDVVRSTLCTATVIARRAILTAKHCVDDGTGAPVPAADLRVAVGPSHTELTALHFVSDVIGAPGSWDVTAGDDLAVLVTSTPVDVDPLPLSFDSPLMLPGRSVTAIGYGETLDGSSGVKLSAETVVTQVDPSFIWVDPAICPGDSGGPLLDTDGRVRGVASFILSEVQACGFPGAYTAIDELESFILGALDEAGTCAPTGDEVCNGRDDDCDGEADEGCVPLGEACTSDAECVGGRCSEVDGARICSQLCDPLQPDVGCPPGMYCALTDGCEGRCALGMVAVAPAPLGTPCRQDGECVSLFCHDPGDGSPRCLQPCPADGGHCLAGEACSAVEGCGGCVEAHTLDRPLGLGEPCDRDGDCRTGSCLLQGEREYCSRPCTEDADCGDAFHCRAEGEVTVCIRGPRQGVGGRCLTSGDCMEGASCAMSGDVAWCTHACDTAAECPTGFACDGADASHVCTPDRALVGETCTTNADCRSHLCVTTFEGSSCSKYCGPQSPCAPGLECVRVDGEGTAVCLSPSPRVEGGCVATGALPGRGAGAPTWLWMAGLLLFVRRHRGAGAVAAVLTAGLLAGGCSDLSEFETRPDEVYRGTVLGVDSPGAMDGGSSESSFIRSGFQQGTTMTLRFDPDRADERNAGTISTDDDCGGAGPTFDDTPLRAIAELQHDQLSLYDFPGGGRLRNYIHQARPASGPLAGRDASVFLSLVRGGKIEVRVVAGFGQADCGPCECFFGVFDLQKEEL